MTSGRPLILGGTGRLGRALLARDPRHRHPTHDELDVTDGEALSNYVAAASPSYVIHAAAIVGRAEVDRDLPRAHRVNSLGTRNVAQACRKAGVRLVYISSAAVFGHAAGPHREIDPTGPCWA